ncbi:MAG: hypothetical protein LBN23_07755 [Paludibacter sp.]|jgi:5-methyltetrahydrofolate--homocysteine methyltransferase|nr:hypothetical protein [Paludibacter sp.]
MTLGKTYLKNIPITEIAPFIHWTFFFAAWNVSGKYDDIQQVCECESCKAAWLKNFSDTEKVKAEEALKLYRDAQELLRRIRDDNSLQINAMIGIYPAVSDSDDNIIVNFEGEKIFIPTLRQQKPSTDGFCYSLADFLSSESDFLGFFANTVTGGEELVQRFENEGDIYQSILVKTLADRIAEATAEWLHYKVRREIWAYSPDEKRDIAEMFRGHYQGIRPAVGYPSLPDLSIIFDFDKIVNFRELGISLTENGAMFPTASVCGLMFAHPKSKYFITGKIDDEQLADYAQRRGKTTAEMRKWLNNNVLI